MLVKTGQIDVFQVVVILDIEVALDFFQTAQSKAFQ